MQGMDVSGDLTRDHLRSITLHSARLSVPYLNFHGILPVHRDRQRLLVATWRENVDDQALDDLRMIFGAEPSLAVLPEADVRDAIQKLYGADAVTAAGVIADLPVMAQFGEASELPLDDLVSRANDAPVIRLVNLLLLEALNARASDVHIEAYADALRVRYRIDGVLQDAPSPPLHLSAAVISRLKIMADLDIAERRSPQDGRVRLKLQDRQVDVRVSTVPILHGESVVLRLLDKARGWGSLDELGMSAATLTAFQQAIARPHGMVLATGPTGSGKTTTLYAAVDHIRTGREKILTVEDPVEYELTGVPQVPVNEKAGVTFATALRSLLRQDPDVMLVGEIRDAETAEIATHAALTGHLVLSTLHTNDAVSALTRLVDLGVPAYLVASTVAAVLAQRLVRRKCGACTHPTGTGARESPSSAHPEECAGCRGTGFRGRTGVYEMLVMNEPLRTALLERQPAEQLQACAIRHGMSPLWNDAMRQVEQGVTTLAEATRVCGASLPIQ
jgi:type II secretory ATPase GspE/PulE/Tfp pilus assembly ATPase PilB-like protein